MGVEKAEAKKLSRPVWDNKGGGKRPFTPQSTQSDRPNASPQTRVGQARMAKVLQRKVGNGRTAQHFNQPPIQRRANKTGLPDTLKSGVESLSGYSMDDVKVHYNSPKPAQLQAHAYAQGTNIHVASGQEKHLPHEAWHVVQQKQGRVAPTLQAKGKFNINNDARLEKEADVMGEKAIQSSESSSKEGSTQHASIKSGVIQRAVGFEFQTGWQAYMELPPLDGGPPQTSTFPKETPLLGDRTGPQGWTMETDGRDIEFVIEPAIDETAAGVIRLTAVMNSLRHFTDLLQNFDTVPKLTPGNLPNIFNPGMGNTTVIEPQGAIRAQPQSTVGVKLERIQDLFNTIDVSGNNLGDFARYGGGPYPGPQAANVSALINGAGNINGAPPSPKLKGLLTLIVQYLVQGVHGGSRHYAKDMAYVMARTDFASMFEKLDAKDKLFFRLTPNSFANYALTTAGLAGQGNGRLINQQVTDGGNLAMGVHLPLTRKQWLDGICQRQDFFTKAATDGTPAYTDVHGGNRLRALGLLGDKFDDVGPAAINEGVIMELRQMKRDIPATEWRDVALAVMNYVRALNAFVPGGAAAPPAYVEH